MASMILFMWTLKSRPTSSGAALILINLCNDGGNCSRLGIDALATRTGITVMSFENANSSSRRTGSFGFIIRDPPAPVPAQSDPTIAGLNEGQRPLFRLPRSALG